MPAQQLLLRGFILACLAKGAQLSDTEQNRKIESNTTRIGVLETNQALTGQKVDDLRTAFDTGMISLKTDLKDRDDKFLEARKQEREDTAIEKKLEREEARWFWGKVFGIVGSVITLASAGGATAWYAMDDNPHKERAELAAPVAAPVAEPEVMP